MGPYRAGCGDLRAMTGSRWVEVRRVRAGSGGNAHCLLAVMSRTDWWIGLWRVIGSEGEGASEAEKRWCLKSDWGRMEGIETS